MVSSPSWEDNLNVVSRQISAAKSAGATLIALPEYFCLMGHSDKDKVKICEQFGAGPIQDALRNLAIKHAIYLVAGTIPLACADKNKVKNTTLVFNPSGEVISRYDKIHLFGFTQGNETYQESNTIEAGSVPTKFSLTHQGIEWTFGLSICYDIRFPELYRSLGLVDCHVVPAAFTYTTGKAHWEILLRARAIENQCYVLASAQGGKHDNGRSTWGQSMLINPWGEIESELKNGEGFMIGSLKKTLIIETRQKLPALLHRTL
jgi:nitrilase